MKLDYFVPAFLAAFAQSFTVRVNRGEPFGPALGSALIVGIAAAMLAAPIGELIVGGILRRLDRRRESNKGRKGN